MEIRGVEIRRVRLPLQRPLRAAHGIEHERAVLLVELHTDRGVGWGECAALAAPTYLPDHLAGEELVLRDLLVPALLADPVVGAPSTDPGPWDVRSGLVGHHTARAALETACLDAWLRAEGRSLASWLGATRTSVAVGATIAMGSIDAVVEAATAAVAEGARRVKLKIGPGHDVEPVRAARSCLGDRVELHVDANGTYTTDDLAVLSRLADLGVVLFEQPLAADDLVGSAALQRHLGDAAAVALDESIVTVGSVATAAALGAARVVSIKPARLGGVDRSVAAMAAAAGAGLGVFVGGMWESGLGRSVAVALAARPEVDHLGDLGPTSAYLRRDLVAAAPADAAGLPVWSGPGTAPEPDRSAVAELTEHIVLSVGAARDRG